MRQGSDPRPPATRWAGGPSANRSPCRAFSCTSYTRRMPVEGVALIPRSISSAPPPLHLVPAASAEAASRLFKRARVLLLPAEAHLVQTPWHGPVSRNVT